MENEVIVYEPLSERERLQRKHLERVIKRGEEWLRRTARALLRIREERLYRDTHATFRSYCLDVFGFSESYSHNICAAGEILETLSKSKSSHFLPNRERQVRSLQSLSEEEQQLAWERACQAAGGDQPTEMMVRIEVDRIRNLGCANFEEDQKSPPVSQEESRKYYDERKRRNSEEFRIIESVRRLEQAMRLVAGSKLGDTDVVEQIGKVIESIRAKVGHPIDTSEGTGAPPS